MSDFMPRRLPPPSTSWWGVSATVRLSQGTTSGLIRVQYQDGAGPQRNDVIFETAFGDRYNDARWSGKLLGQLVAEWKEREALLRAWDL